MSIRGIVKYKDIKKINNGIEIKKIRYRNIQISIEKFTDPNTWLIVKLKEGKNREIRKICEYFSWKISKLIRIQYGPYKLLNLKKGKIIEIKKVIF